MSEESFRVAELLLDDFKCSHILMRLALEAQGRDDPDLIRAMPLGKARKRPRAMRVTGLLRLQPRTGKRQQLFNP